MKTRFPEINGHKTCKHCLQSKPVDQFHSRTANGRPYIVARCKKCNTKISISQRDSEKRRLYERERFSNPEKRAEKNRSQREWRKNNIEKNRAYHRKNIKKNVDELTDLYVMRAMFRSTKFIVPSELIAAKREQLKLKRLLNTK